MENIHVTNMMVHVIAGTLALMAGLVALIVKKGQRWHRLMGRFFLYLMVVVIFTALVGVFLFGRNTFLLVITVLSGYLAYSGYRVLKTKAKPMRLFDVAIALLALVAVSYFLYYFYLIGLIWSPVIIYSTVGYLLLILVYDFAKFLMLAGYREQSWIYEHILKMTSAFSGLLSAFAGTLFSQYQPYSQFIPSILGTIIAIVFMLRVRPSLASK